MNLNEQLCLLGDFQQHALLKSHTSMRVGGLCYGVFYPNTINNLIEGIQVIKQSGLPFKLLGNGSNVLCSDDPYDGVIIKFSRYLNEYQLDDNLMLCDAGCSMIAMAYRLANLGLSGMEFASGIPGTIGGGVFMNAGAYKSEMAHIVNRVMILDDQLQIRWLTNAQCQFAYRKSIFQQQSWLILKVELILHPKDKEEILSSIQTRKQARVSTQPLDLPSAGSCFKNPVVCPAWSLIDQVGLRGYRIGGVSISTKHCNFIVNDMDGSAQDVMDLIKFVEVKVFNKFNITLEREMELFNWHE
jgi:UDP-N-acetylmuramate dehydrogenase